ncbi:hypothetical protein NC653_022896 [Populus alba x Populus x berolinensis]|uniref:Uncharacterized protein n=1 Tax=Populus alba x Populus x berolinensis TaxID=444605 RepID=A0AAD6MFT1_9ROSI|nr:hypothetical protein NC653_022896 [Populus alba x Populus x berolinensis]
MLMAWPPAQVIVPVGIIFILSGVIVINLIQVIHNYSSSSS